MEILERRSKKIEEMEVMEKKEEEGESRLKKTGWRRRKE